MTVSGNRIALLIAAHGERGGERPAGANNEATFRIAHSLSANLSTNLSTSLSTNLSTPGLICEVAVGFIRGEPSIKEALGSLTAPDIIVYPLFVANGYFTRDRLAQLLEEANGEGRKVRVMAPLGLDPGLPELVIGFAAEAARKHAFEPSTCNVILLAHGSKKNPASRKSTEQMERALEASGSFRSVRGAFLEEAPSLQSAAEGVQGPIVVVGMFSGEGLHGAKDAPQLVSGLRRDDAVFAGVIGTAAGVADLIARSVENALHAAPGSVNAAAEWVSVAP